MSTAEAVAVSVKSADLADVSSPVTVMSSPLLQGLSSLFLFLHADSVRSDIVRQLEYYFSPENLMRDQFLQSKMDAIGYVLLSVIAEFPKLKSLTGGYKPSTTSHVADTQVILDAVKTSKKLQLDETQSKIRPAIQRNRLLLRDIPLSTPVDELRAFFGSYGCDGVVSLQPDVLDTWYVVFNDEDSTIDAFEKTLGKPFNGKPISAAIKSQPVQKSLYVQDSAPLISKVLL
jgi:la-related protein 4